MAAAQQAAATPPAANPSFSFNFGGTDPSWSATPPKGATSNWYTGHGYEWTPMGWQTQNQIQNAEWGFGGGFSAPAYPRVSAVPSWLPGEGAGPLQSALAGVPGAFSSAGFDAASQAEQGRVLTQGLSAANNAAMEYANKARQSGGSGLGAGLLKAEGAVSARSAAGDIALKQQEFDASQREKAATLSSQIANNLGDLRQNYLKSIIGYATSEDQISADYYSKALGSGSGSGSGGRNLPSSWTATIPNAYGMSLGISPVAYNPAEGKISMPTSATNLTGPWNVSNFGGPRG